MKIVIWKDGTYKLIDDNITHEFENDKDWLITIETQPTESGEGKEISFLKQKML